LAFRLIKLSQEPKEDIALSGDPTGLIFRGGRMKRLPNRWLIAVLLLITPGVMITASAQITPSQDAYINTASPGTNYGTAVTLGVVSPSQTTFIAFDLSSIPAGYTGSSITKATLKLYVSSVTTAGSFNVDLVNGSWTEAKLTANNAPALGPTIAASVPLTKSQARDYILIDITSALQDWLNGTPNDGIALVANSPLSATVESKENIKESHNAELDVVFAGGGTITGVLTGSASGLTGGGTKGTLNISLLTNCKSGQVLAWNGSAWGCTTVGGTGTVTSVGLSAPASDFVVTGSPVTTSGTLGLNWNVAPTSANTANAIVKRDSSGSFFVNSISGTGAFSTSTTGNFTTAMSGAISGTSSFGVFGSAVGGKSAGVAGFDTDPGGIGVLGQNGRTSDEFSVRVGQFPVGVWGDSTGYGVVATSDSNAVVAYNNNSSASTIFAENDSSNGAGLLFYATDPNVKINGSSALFAVTNTGQVGMGTASPSATLHINEGGNASNDSLLIGNNTTKGLQLRDTGTAVDLESIGVPLFANLVTQQAVNIGGGPHGPGDYALAVGANNGLTRSAFVAFDVAIAGNLGVSGTKNFRIDHPLDPANKYLDHAAIESSEVLNLYSGNALLNENGETRIELPAWFEALNTDFRYQLTAIGAPGPNLYVAEEINHNGFRIAGGTPGMKVSWQVTCQRNDAHMKAHPFVAETDKPASERGHYNTYQLSEKDAFPYRK
jgi:hypothetical protein